MNNRFEYYVIGDDLWSMTFEEAEERNRKFEKDWFESNQRNGMWQPVRSFVCSENLSQTIECGRVRKKAKIAIKVAVGSSVLSVITLILLITQLM